MRVLFCHDNVFIRARTGQLYSSGQFPYSLWQRYLETFDEVVVAGRCHELDAGEATSHLNLSSGPRVSFVRLPNLSSVAGLTTRRRRAAATLVATMAKVDGVIARLPSEIGLLAAALADKLDKPLVVEAVACAWDACWNHGSLRGRLYAPLQTSRMRRAVDRAPFVLYVSQFMRRRYPTRGAATVVSDVDLPLTPEAVLQRREEHIASDRERLVLGLIGSLQHKYKGVHTALDALARVRDRLPPFELRLLGPGDPRPWQKRAAACGLADRVRFDSVLPTGGPVLAWLDEIDLYLQPSFQEGLPRTLIEAMSRACPAVASTAGGIPELLPPECLHRPGDVAGLAELIAQGARDPVWQAVQARRNFERSRAYAREVLDARWQAFWRDFRAQLAAPAVTPGRAAASLAPRGLRRSAFGWRRAG